jgi:hypothetical protein
MAYNPKNKKLLDNWEQLRHKLDGRTVGRGGWRAKIKYTLAGPAYHGGVVLDRPIEGLSWWNMDSLTLYPKKLFRA